MNNNLTISRENALAAYDNADANGRELLEHLFGKEDKKDITERVKTFEDACNELGDEHSLVEEYRGVMNINFDMTQDLITYLKLRIITAALNEGWEPKFEKGEYRYFPWFYLYTKEQYDELDDEEKGRCVLRSVGYVRAGCGFVHIIAYHDDALFSSNPVGWRLAFKTCELAEYAGRQFVELYADFIFPEKA